MSIPTIDDLKKDLRNVCAPSSTEPQHDVYLKVCPLCCRPTWTCTSTRKDCSGMTVIEGWQLCPKCECLGHRYPEIVELLLLAIRIAPIRELVQQHLTSNEEPL